MAGSPRPWRTTVISSAGHVHHGGRLGGAGAGVDHRRNAVGEVLKNHLRVVERLGLAGRDQGGGQQRRTVQGQQFLQHLVVGHAQPDGLALGVAQAPGHFLGGFENEGEGAGRGLLEQAKLLVVHDGVVGQLAQVAAQQGQVVLLVDAADAAQLVGRRLVVEVAGQRVARIGRDGHDAAAIEQGRGLLEQANLGIVRMDAEMLGHGVSLSCQRRRFGPADHRRRPDTPGLHWMRSASRSQTGVSSAGRLGSVPRSMRLSSGLWKSLPREAARPNSRAMPAYVTASCEE
jgi:hypothetical protein